MKTTYYLVYQGGIANVFKDVFSTTTITKTRILQDNFNNCEFFCRGLLQGGQVVRVAWCNEAGDIIDRIWHFGKFEDAPFHDEFGSDLCEIVLNFFK